MGKLDLKFYWAVFLRRSPYFMLVAALLTAIGLTVAFILPPVYISRASILVEPQQISGNLVQSTVAIDPYQQIQILQRRVMTRASLFDLAQKTGIAADNPDATTEDIIQNTARRIVFSGGEPQEVTRNGPSPEAIMIGVSFEADNAPLAARGANEVVNLILQENLRSRTSKAEETVRFFEAEVERLTQELEETSAAISDFKTENVESLPDSLETRRQQQSLEQERLLALEREESALRNERATTVWVFERTGTTGNLVTRSPEEQELEALKSERIKQLAVYAPTSSRIRILDTRIAALERLVEEQRATRVAEGGGDISAGPSSELDLELAPIDARLEFIAQEKALIEQTLVDLQNSIGQTPSNEMILERLERDMASLRAQHDSATSGLAQAQAGLRIELDAQGERFTVIENPVEPTGPESPNRKLIAMAGMAGGIGAGLGLIVLMELLNRSIRRPVDLTSTLGIQPIATIPYIRTASEARLRRGLIVGSLVFVLVVIPLGLFLVNTYYMPLDLLVDQIKEILRPGSTPEIAEPAQQ